MLHIPWKLDQSGRELVEFGVESLPVLLSPNSMFLHYVLCHAFIRLRLKCIYTIFLSVFCICGIFILTSVLVNKTSNLIKSLSLKKYGEIWIMGGGELM